MKVTFVRHGETDYNVSYILCSPTVGKLTKKGREQAKKLGKRLSNEKFSAIYCSDSSRTKETAKYILKYHKKAPITYTPELLEIHRGEFIGRKGQEFWEAFKKSKKSFARWKPKRGESPMDVTRRIKKFFKKIYKKHKGQHILFVSHGGVNRAIRDICNNTTPNVNELKEGNNENASIGVLEFNKKGEPKLKMFNYTKHLK